LPSAMPSSKRNTRQRTSLPSARRSTKDSTRQRATAEHTGAYRRSLPSTLR
jgi:hypothetical protein